MPLALIKYSERVSGEILTEVSGCIQKQLSSALSVGGRGELSPLEIEIWAFSRHNRDDSSPKGYDLEIVVFAMNFPEREKLVQDAAEEVALKLELMLSGTGLWGFVYVLLAPAGFSEFFAA